MIKIINRTERVGKIISAKQMLPLQVAEIIEGASPLKGHIVMRTASTAKFEIIGLTEARADRCWTSTYPSNLDFKVRLLPPDEFVDIRLQNNEGGEQ